MRLVPVVVTLLLFCAVPGSAQQPVWVFLRPEAVRSGPMVTGVRRQVGLDNDRAIPTSLIKKIAGTGAHVRYTSRWLRAVSVDADSKTIKKLQALREVTGIRPLAWLYAQTDRTFAPSHTPTLADFDSAFYGFNYKAIKQLGIPPSHQLGFTGKGIKIAILDTGFEPAHDALITRRVFAQRDFINRDEVVSNQPGDPPEGSSLDQEQHGTWVWSVLGGFKQGKIVGPAFDGVFILAKVDRNDGAGVPDSAVDEDRWVAAVEWADSNGARIINSSLAYRDFINKPNYTPAVLNGDITPSARMADEAARRQILVVTAMGNTGNEGASSLWSPADADSVIAVGAVDSLGQVAAFSSRGPSGDGRLKPELAAPGVRIVGARSSDQVSYDSGLNGTSLATPFIAGGAAMFMQAWPNLTIMAIRNALILSATRASSPDNNVGNGVPDISSAILFPEGLTAPAITVLNLQNELTTIQPTFTWSAPLVNLAMAPVHYRLEIATDQNFNNIIYTDSTDAFSLTLKQPLRPAPVLFARVVAQAFPNITRASGVKGPFSMPDWVRLLTFNTGATLTDTLRPTLRWEALLAPPPSGPLTFDVQIVRATTGIIEQSMRNLTTASVQPTNPLPANIAFKWRVIAKSNVGIADTVESKGTFTINDASAPPTTTLYQNFPNPFPRSDLGETSTHVWFDVNTRSTVELAVYDLRGRLVRRLIPGASSCGEIILDPGQYGRSPVEVDACVKTSWDGTDTNGNVVPKGIYMLRLRAGGIDQVKKILYLP